MARQRTLRRRLFWGILGYVVTSLATLATTWLTSLDVSPLVGSLLATGVGLLLVIIGVLMDHAQEGGEQLPPPVVYQPPSTYPYPPTPYPSAPYPPGPYPTPVRPRPGRSIAAVLTVILLLCGAGGFGLAYGAQWAGQWAIARFNDDKTKDPGTERLGGPASHTEGVLTVSVSSVRVNDQVTMLTVQATNAGDEALQMPLFGYTQLTVPGTATLKPDPFAGTWPDNVPAAAGASGVIVFDGVLGPDVTEVTLSFTQIFGTLGGPRSISVDIPIVPAA
jgi:hypothetical protein